MLLATKVVTFVYAVLVWDIPKMSLFKISKRRRAHNTLARYLISWYSCKQSAGKIQFYVKSATLYIDTLCILPLVKKMVSLSSSFLIFFPLLQTPAKEVLFSAAANTRRRNRHNFRVTWLKNIFFNASLSLDKQVCIWNNKTVHNCTTDSTIRSTDLFASVFNEEHKLSVKFPRQNIKTKFKRCLLPVFRFLWL